MGRETASHSELALSSTSGNLGRDLQAGRLRFLSVLSAVGESGRLGGRGNVTTYVGSLLTAFSDAGSTPAASTRLKYIYFSNLQN